MLVDDDRDDDGEVLVLEEADGEAEGDELGDGESTEAVKSKNGSSGMTTDATSEVSGSANATDAGMICPVASSPEAKLTRGVPDCAPEAVIVTMPTGLACVTTAVAPESTVPEPLTSRNPPTVFPTGVVSTAPPPADELSVVIGSVSLTVKTVLAELQVTAAILGPRADIP